MTMRTQKNQLTTKKKSLTIHIDTTYIGPHGMPLVYGSTPSRVGSIRGTVRFASNYDCKGRDIQIIYEAWSESRWTAMENKKLVQHHSRKVLGYQTWSFPLIHTKTNGSRVVQGCYEQDFEAFFIKPPPNSASTSSSFFSRTSCDSTHGSPTSSSISVRSHARSHLRTPISSSASSIASNFSSSSSSSSYTHSILPSSSTNPDCTIKYTIRAVLQRPFPSLSNVEASQEVWVVHSDSATSSNTKKAGSDKRHMESSIHESQPEITTANGLTPCSTSATSKSTPAQKIASDWLTTTSLSNKSIAMAPMPSTPYGRNQLAIFIYYFCTIVFGLGICKRYTKVDSPLVNSPEATFPGSTA
ncbi:hypothetical protein FBU30_008664 [Linnemannia zychae]|nr:hypothetical protein FBU30_008664 [Linnemannia zychae]